MAIVTRPLLALMRADRARPVIYWSGDSAFVGDADPGVNWTCRRCGRELLKAAWEGQFLDLLFRCPVCEAISASARRSPGEAMPANSMRISPRRWNLRSPVDVKGKPVLVAGKSAFDGYVRATGATYAGPRAPTLGQVLDETMLRRLARQTARLLGRAFEGLLEADERGLKSSTPPAHRHRLIELIRYAEDAAHKLANRKPEEPIELDGDALSELVSTVELFMRWRHHPAWPSLRDSLVNASEVQHSVMTLGIASLLVDAGNGVELVDHSGAEHRVCDVVLVPRIIERLEIEVKTPIVLRHGKQFVGVDARKLAADVIDRAAATTGGQLDPKHSGIVAIGAFHLGKDGLDRLEAAVTEVLARQAKAGRKEHLMAVIIFEVSFEVTTSSGGPALPTVTGMSPAINHRLVNYPGYGRTLSFSQQTPWKEWPTPSDPKKVQG